MLEFNGQSARTGEERAGAVAEDFEEFFAKQNTDLLRLSLHLTADAEKAESCLILAMRDCLFRSNVSRDRVQAWARRMVVRNAIRLVWRTTADILGQSGFEFHMQPSDLPLEALRESIAILSLPDMDRVAFVMCVLERYSILDCALILGAAPQDVYDAIVRATNRILPPEQQTNHETALRFPLNVFAAYWDQGSKLDASCGANLDS